MIAPTGRLILLAAAGAPAASLLGLARPEWWVAAPLWIGLCIGLFVLDTLISASVTRTSLVVAAPSVVGVGEEAVVRLAVTTDAPGAARKVRAALEVDSRLSANGRIESALRRADDDLAEGVSAIVSLTPRRRGPAAIVTGWVSWLGPLGLVRKQRRVAVDQGIGVVPSIKPVREEGAKLFARDAMVGQRLHARLGEGSEFESLVRFMPGLDRRAIDWKQSARHADLLAKQFETERDNRIVFAVDCGRMMSEPIVTPEGHMEPRLDRAVSAALTLGYVALRLEDRVSLFAFAGKPRLASREFSRLSDFAALRRAAGDIDYGAEETNYTLALASLGASLKRRAMIVIFTEFADANSTELMLRAAERLSAKHLLLFVVMADSELDAIATRVPQTAEDMAGATIAAELLRDRQLVLTRLRRMGALVLEAPASGVSASLLATYVRVKRQGLI